MNDKEALRSETEARPEAFKTETKALGNPSELGETETEAVDT